MNPDCNGVYGLLVGTGADLELCHYPRLGALDNCGGIRGMGWDGSARICNMRNFFAVGMLSAALLSARPVVAQSGTGSLDITAQITPTGGRPEPVRQFPLCLLTKSYAEIVKEVEGQDPLLTRDQFIDTLKSSPQLREWIKGHEAMDLTQIDFDKLVTVDDIMNVPEFLAAYQRSNGGGVTSGLPVPKFREADKEANPEKFEKLKTEYLTNMKKFIQSHPSTITGMELELGAVSPKVAWDKVQVDHRRKVAQLAPDTAQSKYLAAKADTDLDGRAALRGIPPGKYWLSTVGVDAASGDRHIHWDVPVTVQAGQTTRVALSNVNGTDANSSAP